MGKIGLIKGCSITSIMKRLGAIDKRVEQKQITEGKHNILTRKVLKGCMRIR